MLVAVDKVGQCEALLCMLALHAEGLVYGLEQELGHFCTEHGSCLIPMSIQTKAEESHSGQPRQDLRDHDT